MPSQATEMTVSSDILRSMFDKYSKKGPSLDGGSHHEV